MQFALASTVTSGLYATVITASRSDISFRHEVSSGMAFAPMALPQRLIDRGAIQSEDACKGMEEFTLAHKEEDSAVSTRPEDEKLGMGANLAYGLQHVLTMYGGIVAVPLILGQAAGLSTSDIGLLVTASLFAGGLATILQTLGLPFFGSRLPLVQGVSFSGVATMVAISGNGGIQAILGAVIVASVIGLLITPVFSRITRFFPPLVTGIVITTIGLTLMPVAAFWAMGGNSKAPDFGSPANIQLAAVTLAIVLLLSKLGSASIFAACPSCLPSSSATGIAYGRRHDRLFAGGRTASSSRFRRSSTFGYPTFEIAAIVSMFIVIMVTPCRDVGGYPGRRRDRRDQGRFPPPWRWAGARGHAVEHHRSRFRIIHTERVLRKMSGWSP